MRCPTCADEGKVSKLFHTKAHPLPGKVDRFWDEDGALHVHDHAVYCDLYACSQLHNNLVESRSRCPQPLCSWNRPEHLHVSGRGPVRT
jgi:hypothetical protein